jgi:hypothetical protein
LPSTGVKPLARPGIAEPDFLLYPTTPHAVAPLGLIELKRPDSQILHMPRREVLRLASPAADALAQARKYALDLGRQTIYRPDQLLAFGNRLQLFLIVGMSHEIAAKLTSDLLRLQYSQLLPRNCNLIPFDTLLEAFTRRATETHVYILSVQLPFALGTLEALLRQVESTYAAYEGYWLSQQIAEAWEDLERHYQRLVGPADYPTRAIDVAGFEIGPIGQRGVATEAPNPSLFALGVASFISKLAVSAVAHGLPTSLPIDAADAWRRTAAYASD